MKKITLLCALLAGVLSCAAQTADTFYVGPYTVDYLGEGNVRYRLQDDIDLYEFFDLRPDTVVVADKPVSDPAAHAIQVSCRLAAGTGNAKDFGVEGLWKQYLKHSLYLNAGLTLGVVNRSLGFDCRTFEAGIPVTVEYGKLVKGESSLYASAGIIPTLFTTLRNNKEEYGDIVSVGRQTGFLISPVAEIGCNVPVGDIHLRMGAYATYRIEATNTLVYKERIGRAFMGGRIAVIF